MRLTAKKRRRQILSAAVALAEQGNYKTITRAQVCEAVGCTEPLVTHYFNDMESLRGAVLVNAIENRNNTILAQAIINRDSKIEAVAKDILKNAIESIKI